MPFHPEFKVRKGYLETTLHGDVRSGDLSPEGNVFQQAIDQCREHNLTRILLDIRDMVVDLDTMDLFRVAMDCVDLKNPTLSISLLCRKEDILPDRFLETAVDNHGGILQVFSSLPKAKAWLMNPVPD